MSHGVVEGLQRRRMPPLADRGMITNIVSWILLVVAIATLIARFAMKLSMSKQSRRLGLDDLFIMLAALFSIGQTVAVSVEAANVLGQHVTDLSPWQLNLFYKAEYVGHMLYIANMGCSRISVCLLIRKILPGTIPNYTALVFTGFTALWTLSGVFVTAFPCRLPHPWLIGVEKNCFDIVKFVNYIGITNIVVEVLLVMIPLFVWNLRVDAGRRLSVSCTFIARLSVVAAVSAQLYYFNRWAMFPDDYTYDYWPANLCIQIAQNLSIITACLPCLHPFIISIIAGKTKTDRLVFDYETNKCGLKDYLRKRRIRYNSTASQSSSLPIKEKDDYCHPLATYGLDRSSAHLHSQHFNRFPTNVAQPIPGSSPTENVFNRNIEIPTSRPTVSSSKGLPPPPPKSLSQVGVLPIIDWDTESSDRDSGRDSPARRPNSEYIFNREKVISAPPIPDEDGEYWKKYYPPLPSPKMPKRSHH